MSTIKSNLNYAEQYIYTVYILNDIEKNKDSKFKYNYKSFLKKEKKRKKTLTRIFVNINDAKLSSQFDSSSLRVFLKYLTLLMLSCNFMSAEFLWCLFKN